MEYFASGSVVVQWRRSLVDLTLVRSSYCPDVEFRVVAR